LKRFEKKRRDAKANLSFPRKRESMLRQNKNVVESGFLAIYFVGWLYDLGVFLLTSFVEICPEPAKG